MSCDSSTSSGNSNNESIVELFDNICFYWGDQDAIVLLVDDENDDDSDGEKNNKNSISIASASSNNHHEEENYHHHHHQTITSVCYLEIQEASQSLACQLHYRYHRPDYVIVECFGHAVAEAVSLLACMRIGVPFVPVEAGEGPQKLKAVLDALRLLHKDNNNNEKDDDGGGGVQIVAICSCESDEDPVLGVFYQAEIHRVAYIDPMGNLREQIRVPSTTTLLPSMPTANPNTTSNNDELYVLFTSGTTSSRTTGTSPKAVIGSHRSTFRRLAWWRDTFSASPRIARRTRLTFVDGITELLSALLHPPSVLVALSQPDRLYSEGIRSLFCSSSRSNTADEEEEFQQLQHHPTQITLLPSQLWQLLMLWQSPTRNTASLHCLERIICSGEVFPPALWEQVQQVLPTTSTNNTTATPRRNNNKVLEVVNLYGQTESTGDVLCAVLTGSPYSCCDPEKNTGKRICRGVVAVGTPIRADISISLGGGDGDQKNELIVTGNLAVAYLAEASSLSSASSQRQRRRLESFATGDVGFCENGIWYVRGRINEMDKINGVWTSPCEVEGAVAQVHGVKHPLAAAIVDGQVYLVSEQAFPSFSRESMRRAGFGWNLIPKQVFHHSIPVRQSAAGKVDHAALRSIIGGLLAGSTLGRSSTTTIKSNNNHSSKKSNDDDVIFFVADVLNLNHRSDFVGGGAVVDPQKSFTELGGDSSSAVTLLYQLFKSGLVVAGMPSITAADILQAESIQELSDIVSGRRQPKRVKRETDDKAAAAGAAEFHPSLPRQFSTAHVAVQFKACVDASPVLSSDGKSFYVGCQGGVFQKFCMETCTVVAHQCFGSWMIQADCVLTETSVLVSMYQRHADKGMVVCVSLDLRDILWNVELDARVQSTPVRMGGSAVCVNAGGARLVLLDISTGVVLCRASLPERALSKPALLGASGRTALYGGSSSLMKAVLLDQDAPDYRLTVSQVFDERFDETIGPIYKDLLGRRGDSTCTATVSGSYGGLYQCDIDEDAPMAPQQGASSVFVTKISSFPLSPTEHFGETGFVVGSYDGFIHFVTPSKTWAINVGASVYGKPLVLPDSTCVVCTTAGNVLQICGGNDDSSSTIVWSHHVAAEIWSNPVLVDPDTRRVAFGARDSRVHVLAIGGGSDVFSSPVDEGRL